jgi:hypothetical protein
MNRRATRRARPVLRNARARKYAASTIHTLPSMYPPRAFSKGSAPTSTEAMMASRTIAPPGIGWSIRPRMQGRNTASSFQPSGSTPGVSWPGFHNQMMAARASTGSQRHREGVDAAGPALSVSTLIGQEL